MPPVPPSLQGTTMHTQHVAQLLDSPVRHTVVHSRHQDNDGTGVKAAAEKSD
jgi:hypothetical protein